MTEDEAIDKLIRALRHESCVRGINTHPVPGEGKAETLLVVLSEVDGTTHRWPILARTVAEDTEYALGVHYRFVLQQVRDDST